MNLGNVAVSAAPHLCRALRNVGMWDMTKQDLLDALKNHPQAPEAIFWWCHCWHGGLGTDLYKIMCDESLGYIPDPNRRAPDKDPQIKQLWVILDHTFGPLVENPLMPIRMKDVTEGQILIHADQVIEHPVLGTQVLPHFACLPQRWPCRVYRHQGDLGVECSILHGVTFKPGTSRPFHPLSEDERGYVVGFVR